MKDMLEYTLLRSWMKSWLRLVRWYYAVAMSPDVTIQELLDGAPVVTTHWNLEQKDSNLVRENVDVL